MILAAALTVALATPSPSPTAPPRFSLAVGGSDVFLDQAAGGPGQTPPEGPLFAAGEPIAPMSPYDWFSGAPLLPGVAGQIQYEFTGTYRMHGVTADAAFLVSGIGGDVTNAIYWGEPLLGPIDPHEGRSWLPYSVNFPTHAGTNDAASAQIVTPYVLSLHSPADRWSVSGGFVTPANYDAFVFTPPPFTSWLPSMNLQTFESAGPAISDLDSWTHAATSLPLLGVDAHATLGRFTVEATDALLPAPPGTAARLTGAAVALDRGDAGRLSFDLIHVDTTGDALTVPTLFGVNPTLHPGPQGDLATSTLADQHQTVAGVRALLHPFRGYDALVEAGRSWYDAGLTDRPGTAMPGDYEHFALTRHFDANDAAGIEYYRMDPRYATAVLPYGIPENLWGIAWAYPGPWLKGTYQLVNDNFGGSNRAGLRVHADMTRGRFEAHAALYEYRQLVPSTYDNLTQTGFVEVDYLTLQPGDLTYGHTRGIDAYAAWHFNRDTLSIDYAQDLQHRDFSGNARGDLVAMRYPQLVFAEQHRFSKRLIAAAGYGRYAAEGTWSTTPVASIYGVGFAGVQWEFTAGQQLFVQIRRYGLTGLPSIPGGPPPTLRGTTLVVDHHFAI